MGDMCDVELWGIEPQIFRMTSAKKAVCVESEGEGQKPLSGDSCCPSDA